MRKILGLVSFALLLAGCAVNSEPVEEVAEPEVVEVAPEPEVEEVVVEPEAEYDPCSTNGNLFIIRAEDNCLEPWPLDSASGILYCNPFGEANDSIVYQPDEDPGIYYALNGSALASGYPDPDPIWLDNPDGTPPKVSLGAISLAALKLCD